MLQQLYYNKQDSVYYPSFADPPAWSIEEVLTGELNIYLLREFPLCGGAALSCDEFYSMSEALEASEKII